MGLDIWFPVHSGATMFHQQSLKKKISLKMLQNQLGCVHSFMFSVITQTIWVLTWLKTYSYSTVCHLWTQQLRLISIEFQQFVWLRFANFPKSSCTRSTFAGGDAVMWLPDLSPSSVENSPPWKFAHRFFTVEYDGYWSCNVFIICLWIFLGIFCRKKN